jgi:hypothetical protein
MEGLHVICLLADEVQIRRIDADMLPPLLPIRLLNENLDAAKIR